MRKNEFLDKLSSYLFWDNKITMLDPEIDKKLIIERVFSRGTECDEGVIFNYYGKEDIKNTVLDIRYFDKRTLNYLSIILDVSKESFRCYKKSQLETPFGIS